jgi:predicted transcriptional regulator
MGSRTPCRNSLRTDVVLPMKQLYMNQIITGLKTYEFRKYLLSRNVERIWFYVTAPESRISHICEIEAGRTRTLGDEPLPLDGLGNKEYNEGHVDWNQYDYAYKVTSVYELRRPLTLEILKSDTGGKGNLEAWFMLRMR